MANLKGVVFGIRDVLVKSGTVDPKMLATIGKLVAFLKSRGIQAVAIGNKDWTSTNTETGEKRDLKEWLSESWGVDFQWFIYGQDGFPAKQTAAALQHVRDKMGWEANEMLYLGNSPEDMQSAVNGGTLFLNALWYGDNTEYGFRFDSPKEVARFIDIFCLREHWWYFQIEDGDLRVYALAPYSTYAVEEYKAHSENFIKTVKLKLGDADEVDFWAKYLCTSMYFSGLYESVNYITPYPSHKKGAAPPSVLAQPMAAFAKCFRGKFIPNLIVRHTTAVESKKNRDTVEHTNQLNTILLNFNPEKSPGQNYAITPLKVGKTVLVVDDLLTNGYSFEAARVYIKNCQAKVICVGFLKTLNRDYHSLEHIKLPIPNGAYQANSFDEVTIAETYGFRKHIVDTEAAKELSAKLDAYADWDWPS